MGHSRDPRSRDDSLLRLGKLEPLSGKLSERCETGNPCLDGLEGISDSSLEHLKWFQIDE
jgi:hypothetical protein